jgi:plasmid stability protein
MPALHVRDLDDAVIAALKARAREHHRSLQGEVRSILEAVARPGGREGTPRRRRLRLRTVRVGRPATFSREIIYDDDGR